MLKINGKDVEYRENISVNKLLAEMEYNPAQVAVEINYEIIDKPFYETTVLKDGDIVEIVQFMGGGSAFCQLS